MKRSSSLRRNDLKGVGRMSAPANRAVRTFSASVFRVCDVRMDARVRQTARAKARGSLGRYGTCVGGLGLWVLMTCGCISGLSSLGDLTSDSSPTKSASKADDLDADKTDGTTPMDRLSINDESFTLKELWAGISEELLEDTKGYSPEQYRSYLIRRGARLITDTITESLLYQQASLRMTPQTTAGLDKYVDAQIRKTITLKFNGVQRRYEKWLESRGQTLDDRRNKMRRELLIASYLEREIKPKVTEPTRAELLATYEDYARSQRRPPRRRMSLIEVRAIDRLPDNVNHPSREEYASAKEQARARTRTALDAIENGRPFAQVAKQYSDGLHAPDGGDWGWIAPGSVREAYEPAVEALYKLDRGDHSGIIETEDRFFLVACTDVDEGLVPDFEIVQPTLMDRYYREHFNRLVTELVTRLRAKAHIRPTSLERFHAALVGAAPPHDRTPLDAP